METITILMLNEHKKIQNILNSFEKENNLEKKSQLCDKFKWAIQKHLFVEEKAIFSFSQDIAGKIVSDVFKLMEEHGEILNLITDIEDELYDHQSPKISKLKDLMKLHEKFEEETFYPKLDQMLNNQQKTELIERIKEVIH
jgi:hypothetical protein